MTITAKIVYTTSDGTEFLSKEDAENHEKYIDSIGFVQKTTTRVVGIIRAIKREEEMEIECKDYYTKFSDGFKLNLLTMTTGFDNAHKRACSHSGSCMSFSPKFLNDVISGIVLCFYECFKRNPSLIKSILSVLLQETENECIRQKGKEYLKSIS